MAYFVVKQLPVFPPSRYLSLAPWNSECFLEQWMAKRVAALLMTGDEMQGLGFDLSEAHELAMWDDEHRFQTRCELDAAFFNLYGLDGHDVEYILDTFPIVKEHDEKAYGEFRTKQEILRTYDAMSEAIKSGRAYGHA